MKKYAFTGDVKKLINIGYVLIHNEGSSYKSYEKDRIYMNTSSKMILDLDDVRRIQRTNFIKFVLDNKEQPELFWFHDIYHEAPFNETLEDMPIWAISDAGNIMLLDQYYKKREVFEEESRELRIKLDNNEISEESFNIELKELKTKHSEFYHSIPTTFDKEIVEQIIELDNLHPLELV